MPESSDITPGMRSLQVHYDRPVPQREALMDCLSACEAALPDLDENSLPCGVLHLPLSSDYLGDAAGDSQVHPVGAAGCAVVPEQSRVHSPYQWPRF